MREGAEISITEDANTHLGDYEFFHLNDKQIGALRELINLEFNKMK